MMSYGARVAILMGSDSDLPVMEEAEKRLEHFGIPYEVHILSAHAETARWHQVWFPAGGPVCPTRRNRWRS